MRYVFAGAGHVAELTASRLQEKGSEVVIIDDCRERIDDLSTRLDASFIHGDVTLPTILNEADPKRSDVLFCLTDSDQTNILAAVAGRSVGFDRVIPSVSDPRFELLCKELKFEEYITPAQAIAERLTKMTSGE